MALRISRYAQVRGRPRPLMGSANRAAKWLHCLSFKSVGYSRRGWVSIPQGYRLHLQNALLAGTRTSTAVNGSSWDPCHNGGHQAIAHGAAWQSGGSPVTWRM